MDELLAIANDVQMEDIPVSMHGVAARCGIPDAVALMVKLPGIPLYIPKSGRREVIKAYVREHHNGHNTLSLAVKLGIDSSKVLDFVRQIEREPNDSSCKMNEYMSTVASECGIEVAQRLMEHFPQSVLYVPHNGLMLLKKSYIRRKFDGTNTIRLAVQLRVSEVFVRKVLSDMYKSKQSSAVDVLAAIRRLAKSQGFVSEKQIDELGRSEPDRERIRKACITENILVQATLL